MAVERWTGLILLLAWLPGQVPAVDPPHPETLCLACHTPHGASGGSLITADSYANLCLSCHTPEGDAGSKAFADADQALPGSSGTSHRWDSGPSGHLEPDPGNLSAGTLRSNGTFAGRVERSFSLVMTSSGDVGTATFDWTDSDGNSGNGTAAASVVLVDGLGVAFENAAVSPSFIAGDLWTIFVRSDIRALDPADPDEVEMANRVIDGKVSCPVCHDPHSQVLIPFDPAAPAYLGPGTGEGRHFQRANNELGQVCLTCHASRDVQSADNGSHPVRVAIPSGDFKTPDVGRLPLNPSSQVVCMTCHATHSYNGVITDDGYLLRDPLENYLTGSTPAMANLCTNCHTLADVDAGSHFDLAGGALWPGGQYGSDFPAHSSEKRGACVNCHWPHGWPDDATPANDYRRLWVERYDTDLTGRSDPDDAEDLCLTCHDSNGTATSDIKTDIEKGTNGSDIFHHPVMDSEQSGSRTVECVDCHNPHQARADHRNAGVSGVDLSGSTITLGSGTASDEQPFLCFKCHGDSFNGARARTSNKRLDFNTSDSNSGYHPVTQVGRNQSANLANALLGGLTTSSRIVCTDCHNSNAFSGSGPVSDTSATTSGPHGSTSAPILRANFNTNYTGSGWSNGNATLCFRCHDSSRLLARRTGDGASTNFYQDNGRDNLHWYHLADKGVTPSCLSCHYDMHSNRTANNTQYRWILPNGTTCTSTSPPPNVKSHMVNFAPDVQANNFSMPRWQIDTRNGTRQCDVSCHGKDMNGENYRPPSGDEPAFTFGPVPTSCP